jgi:hypothetical protein
MTSVDKHFRIDIFTDNTFLAKLIIKSTTRNCSSQTDEVLLGDLVPSEETPSGKFPQSSFKIIGKWSLPNIRLRLRDLFALKIIPLVSL